MAGQWGRECLMPSVAARVAGAGGGIVQPVTPSASITMSGTSGTVTITNDDPTRGQSYTVTPSTGSASMTGASGTLSGIPAQSQSANGAGTTYSYYTIPVVATSRKGGLTATATLTLTRSGYTTYYWNGNCCGWNGPDEFGNYFCNCYTGGGWLRNGTPGGYSDSGSDWYQVT